MANERQQFSAALITAMCIIGPEAAAAGRAEDVATDVPPLHDDEASTALATRSGCGTNEAAATAAAVAVGGWCITPLIQTPIMKIMTGPALRLVFSSPLAPADHPSDSNSHRMVTRLLFYRGKTCRTTTKLFLLQVYPKVSQEAELF